MLRSTFKYYNSKFAFQLMSKRFCTNNINTYTNIKLSYPDPSVGLILLNRPKVKNALNSQLIKELNAALSHLEENENIGCIVLGGDKDYFASGADIKEMKDKTYSEVYGKSMLEEWNFITRIRY